MSRGEKVIQQALSPSNARYEIDWGVTYDVGRPEVAEAVFHIPSPSCGDAGDASDATGMGMAIDKHAWQAPQNLRLRPCTYLSYLPTLPLPLLLLARLVADGMLSMTSCSFRGAPHPLRWRGTPPWDASGISMVCRKVPNWRIDSHRRTHPSLYHCGGAAMNYTKSRRMFLIFPSRRIVCAWPSPNEMQY